MGYALKTVTISKHQTGSSLIEVLIGLAIGLVILTAIGTAYVNSNNLTRQREDQSQLNDPATIVMRTLRQNLTQAGYVDIFDAGPTVEARVEQVRTVRDSKRFQVRIGEVSGGEPCLISNTSLAGFRACWAELNLMAEQDYIIIPPALATALNVSADDWVRVSKI